MGLPDRGLGQTLLGDALEVTSDRQAARAIRVHLENILTYFTHRITNAGSEGINSKNQPIEKVARGFRNRRSLQDSNFLPLRRIKSLPGDPRDSRMRRKWLTTIETVALEKAKHHRPRSVRHGVGSYVLVASGRRPVLPSDGLLRAGSFFVSLRHFVRGDDT